MQNALVRNRVFAIVTAVAMILGSIGATFAPSVAQAASGGDLIKGTSLSTVYYYGYDGSRYTFPNEKTFMTWFSDFSDVETITDSALADISLAGNVVYRPGSRWIKITSDPNVYVVSTDGTIRWIESEEVAEDFAGSDWASFVEDVPDVFFTDYEAGSSLTTAAAYEGMMYMDGSSYYTIWSSEKRMVSSAGRSTNNMQSRFFLDGSGIDDSAYSSGDDITSEVSAVTDVAQQGGDTGTATGDVTVKLSSSNPDGTSVPTNANSLEVMSFDLKAGSEAAEVDQIAVKLVGLSSTTDVSNVYLYEDNTRLTEARSVNSSTLKATFGSLSLDLEAGETRTLTVRVTISASAGDEIQFAIYEEGDVDAGDGSVAGSFPVEGDTFEVSSVTAGTVTIIDTGSVDSPSLGENDATIGSFKVTTATEKGLVESLTLKIDNSADHTDFKMLADDAQVATGEYIGDKLVVFDFATAYEIAKGQNETFTVTADIGGEAADVVRMYMDNAIDVEVTGGTYGFPMAATITGYDASACTTDGAECNYSTILGGDVTFALSGPSTGDIRTNSNDQTLLEFTLTTVQDITIKDLDIIVYADDDDNDPFDATDDDAANANGDADGLVNTSTEANITDIKLINADTGETVMGPLELDALTDAASADDADQTIDFTDDFELDAGETLTLQVVVDVDDSLTSGTELGATLDISGFVAEDSNGDTLTNATDVVPSSDIQGYAQTARSASLTMSLASTPTDFTTIQGMSDVNVVDFDMVAGDAGDVLVTNVMLSVYGDADGSGTSTIGGVTDGDVNDFVSTCSLYDISGVLLDGPESPAANGQTITFGDIRWTLAAGETEKLQVYCTFANPSDAGPDYFTFDIADASEDVDAEDEDGTDVDPLTSAAAAADALNGGTTLASAVIVTVAAAGSLAVAVDSGTPSEDFVLTGSTDNAVSSFRFTATNEAFEIVTLTVAEQQAEQDDADGDADVTGDPATYANNISLVTLEYPLEDGTTGSATATMNGAEAKFSLASAPLYVETGDPSTVDVFVNVPATSRASGGSATSNEKMMFDVFVDTTNDDNFKANGVGSGSTLDDDDLTATSTDPYTFVVKETKPTISLSSSSPSGTKVPGDQEVFRFNVAAASNEDVVISELIWKVSSTDNATSTWNYCDTTPSMAGVFDEPIMDLYNLSTTGTGTAIDDDAEWVFYDGDMSVCTENTDSVDYVGVTFSATTEYIVVPAGDTYSFALYFDSTGASSTNDDAIQFTLMGDPILSSSSFLAGSDLNESNVTSIDTTITVTAGTSYTVGDILCMATDDGTCADTHEKMLLTAISTNDLTVIRGYLGTEPEATLINDAGDDLDRMPAALLWEDDGDAASANAGEDWGAYLVDGLPLTGGALQF